MCESCIRRGCHPEHPFAKQSHPGGQWETVDRDDYPKVDDAESGTARLGRAREREGETLLASIAEYIDNSVFNKPELPIWNLFQARAVQKLSRGLPSPQRKRL